MQSCRTSQLFESKLNPGNKVYRNLQMEANKTIFKETKGLLKY